MRHYGSDGEKKISSYSNASQLDLRGRGDLGGSESEELLLMPFETLKKSRLLLLSEFVGFDFVAGHSSV